MWRGTLVGLFRNLHMVAIAVVVVALIRSGPSGGQVVMTGLVLALMGITLNLVVICANGGRMPFRARGRWQAQTGYVAMNRRTRLRFLGDWIDAGRWFISPGDVCIFAGLVLLLAVKSRSLVEAE
jgi:Family of unknown function (DUF5317)